MVDVLTSSNTEPTTKIVEDYTEYIDDGGDW